MEKEEEDNLGGGWRRRRMNEEEDGRGGGWRRSRMEEEEEDGEG